jgi:acetyl esterase/lipase
MPLDRHAKRFLDMVAVGKTDRSPLSPDAMRQAFNTLARAVDARNVPIGACENRDISGPAGAIPLRIYTPVTDIAGSLAGSSVGPLPALIFFHGGAGVFCSIETHDGLCRILANESGCRVISVGYRLAPENKFPAAIDDACAATAWVFAQCDGLEIDPACIGVAGDSAGATLATVVCQQARRMTGPRTTGPSMTAPSVTGPSVTGLGIALQVLICPVTDPGFDTPSRRAFSQGYFFDMATLDWALGHYLPAGVDLSDPRLSPLRADDFGGLPPAHIHTAEFDPFRDEGEAYADVLRRARVPVAYTCHAGMIHHFYCMAGAIPNARGVLKGIGNAVRDAFSGRPAAG